MGYAIGPKELLKKMTVCKQGEDVHTAILPQMICDEFMGGYDFEKHLEHLRAIYRHKAGLMLSLIDRHLVPAGVTYDPVQGGLFVWCRLPDGADMPRFCQEAVKVHKVAVVPGNAFLTDEKAALSSLPPQLLHPHRRRDGSGHGAAGKVRRRILPLTA